MDIWHKKWVHVLRRITILETANQEQSFLRELSEVDACRILGFVNAHAMNMLEKEDGFYSGLVGADFLLRDGSGMKVLYNKFRKSAGMNLNGTDFIPKILQAYRGRRVAFWGTTGPVVNAAAESAEVLYGSRIVSKMDGFKEVGDYIQLAKTHVPELIILGMGMPKQEVIAQALRHHSSAPALIVCGGAIIDFLGGKVPRAPTWMRRFGIEWVFRLLREPKRMFARYVIGNPKFLIRANKLTRRYSEID
ncbi:MAG: WecB/TagA/CpsF family glycosyltransferase [Candidatus Sedimenticola sp. (ex Thyasira tokunagai)]